MKTSSFLALFILTFSYIVSQNPCAPKMVLMEEACAKNCGPCYFHCQEMNTNYAKHKNQMAMVVYNQSPIGVGTWTEHNKPYYAFGNIFNLQYQSMVMMDRTFFPNNYLIQQGPTSEGVEDDTLAFNTQIASSYVPVSLSISNSYNTTTRAVNINVTANFCDTASGDLRLYLVLTQDTVRGPSNTYDYAQNINASVGSVVDGYTVEAFNVGTSTFNGIASWPFINVVKYQPSGFFGNAGVIPNNPVIGTAYTENFSFTLPLKNSATEAMNIDASRIQIVAAVVRNGTFKKRQVLNANKKYLITPQTSISEASKNNMKFNVVNPVTNVLILNYSANTKGTGDIYLYNATGQAIKTIKNIEYNTSVSNTTIDVNDLANGIYFVSFNTEGIFYTRQVVISK
jgi:Secretion system C-terminal sorting domain